MRAGRTIRVRGGGRIREGRGAGDWKKMLKVSSLGNAAKHATIASGERKSVEGIPLNARVTRLLVDKRSVGNAGKEMLCNRIFCKRGADPPKNPQGRTGATPPIEKILIYVSTGNGSCIGVTIFSNSEPVTQRST